jgi:hypothetical protein
VIVCFVVHLGFFACSGRLPKAEMIVEKRSGRARTYIRIDGRPGGMMGGPGGVWRGSIDGDGVWRLKGLMMIGGTVGGADGGPFGPPANAPRGPAGWTRVA